MSLRHIIGRGKKNATLSPKGLSIMKQKITSELRFCRNIHIDVVSGRQMIHELNRYNNSQIACNHVPN